MPDASGGTAASTTSSTSDQSFVPTSLTSLIPVFDPATDSVEVWAQKVELLSKVWPADKLSELTTRLILNCKGSAFQKLQIRQKDLLKNDLASVKLLVELVGGQFGQVPLEKRYEAAERALFRCSQRSDESNDSYLARTDVAWSEFLAQDPPMAMADLQAYVTLRGSLLSSDDKKRVLIEAGAETGGNLTTKKVNAAIRMLGAGFFQDYTGAKKTRLKTYDQTAFHTEEIPEGDETAFTMEDEWDEDFIDTLLQEGDEDAILVSEYEGAINDTLQDDQELAVALNAYSDARRRLSERFRNRGFWPIRSSKGKGKGGSFKGKGKFGGGRKSLQDRILSSRCRICNKLGHWKAECPERAKPSSSSTSSGPTASISMTEGSQVGSLDGPGVFDEALTLEFMNLPETLLETPLDESRTQDVVVESFLSVGEALKGISNRSRGKSRLLNSSIVKSPRNESWMTHEPEILSANSAEVMFASHGSFGVVDLGASKTVIGSNHLSELMQSFDDATRDRLQRCPCRMQFRFGNQGILSSEQALVVPIGALKVKIAIVPGNTPFLISNAFLRGLQAIVDTHDQCLKSPLLKQVVPLVLSPRGLFLMDLNEIIRVAKVPSSGTQIETVCHVVQKFVGQPEGAQSSNINESHKSKVNQTIDSGSLSVEEFTKMSKQPMLCSNDRSSAQESPSRSEVSVASSSPRHVACQSIGETASSGQHGAPKPRSLLSARIGGHGHRLREDAQGSHISTYVGHGAGVDSVVHPTLQQLHSHESSTGAQIHREEGGVGRNMESTAPSVSSQHGVSRNNLNQSNNQCDGGSKEQAQGQAESSQDDWPTNVQLHAGDDGRERIRDVAGVGTPATLRWPDNDHHAGRCDDPSRTYVQHGELAPAGIDPSAAKGSRNSECEAERVSDDSLSPWDALLTAGDLDGEEVLNHVFTGKPSPDKHRFLKALQKIDTEYQNVCKHMGQPPNHAKRQGCRVDLFEVFCSSKSRLTHQVNSLGGCARRYFKEQCDLMTSEGRTVLFQDLMEHEPWHVWFSPECGPWSAWSNLNQSRSIQGWLDVQNKRWANMDQLALGVVLLRHQRRQGKQFHWEQPNRSQMFQSPILQEVFSKTIAAEFDMCNLGNLSDPETGKLMKKGMTILTTSPNMQKLLHGHRCKGDHEHQPLEGSTMYQGQRINRTAFSENYPRKFARKVASQILKQCVRVEKPWEWEKHEALTTETAEPHIKRRRISVPAAVRSRLRRDDRPETNDEGSQPKRFRILHKGDSDLSHLDQWRKIIEDLTPNLPRVCKQEISQEEIRSRIQRLVTDKIVKVIIGGRALTRTTGPINPFASGEAPFRKMVYIHRNTDKIHVTPWEAWEDLAKRKLVRPGFPSKVAITIFAANPDDSNPIEARSVPSLGSGESTLLPESTTPVSDVETPTSEFDEESSRHGPAFLSLSKEDRSLLLKIHKNAGHPGPDKLAYLLRQQGYRPELIAAVPDLSCSACKIMSRPKISRPSAIHSPCDFDDVISMDGYTWKNQQGTSFHFYHIVDSSTNFQVARYAPNRSVEHAIDCLTQAWFAWAGSPNELIVDAATELNAEAFARFMQQNNIKCSTISTNAHWQNGKAERHGEILGQMLSKFDVEQPIKSAVDLQQALAHCSQAKNALSIRKGYAPEVLVLGKHTRLPGAVCSDDQLPAHALADSEHCHGLLFRQNLAKRELARRAYHMADNDAVLRRSLLRRSRPSRQWFHKGEWVMVWRGGLNSGWHGPMRVVIHENQQVVWVTQNGRLFRHAPEHIRLVTAIESRMIKDEDIQCPLPEVSSERTESTNPQVSSQEGIPSVSEVMPTTVSPVTDSHATPVEPNEPAGEPTPPASDDAGSNHDPQISVEQLDGSEIPVPDDCHDELVGWHCLEEDNIEGLGGEQGWFGEILITEEDLVQWKNESNPHEMAFLATAAKRQRSEIKIKDLTADELQKFNRAKQGEINNWLSTQTVKRVFRNQIPEDQILRCRWLLTWKPVENPQPGDEHQKAKARLIVLGYLDPQLDNIPRDSPTMSKISRMLVLQLISSENWDLMSFDVKAAFLQGTQSDRVLGLEPVPELAQAMKLKPQEICQLVKGAYGLVDAPYLWYRTLRNELINLGFQTSPFDPCVFVLYDSQKKPIGVIGIHVDDGLCGGTVEFHQKLQQLEKKYPFGSKKMGTFTFTGIDLQQNPDYSINLSQSKYVRNIKPIPISQQRKAQTQALVSEEERQQLRGLIGSLQYASVHTRPDLSSRLSALQSKVNSATVDILMNADRALHEAKSHHDVTIRIQPIRAPELRFLAFTDASFASAKVPDSQSGNMIVATHKNIEQNISCPISPLAWGSKKIQKVVTSTLAAETMSLSSSLDMLSWVRLYWSWLYNPNSAWKNPVETLENLPKAIATATLEKAHIPESLAATDCKSLYDLVTRTAPPNCQEFRTQLQTRAIKEQLAEGVNLRWVHSGAQLADALTKVMESHFLRETLRVGRYKLNDETEVLRERACTKTRLKWLREGMLRMSVDDTASNHSNHQE